MHVLFKQCVTLAKIINQKKRGSTTVFQVSVVGSFLTSCTCTVEQRKKRVVSHVPQVKRE